MNLRDEINNANKLKYGDIENIEDYLNSNYHKIRIHIAVNLLEFELKKIYTHVENKNLNILEIGASTGIISQIIKTKGFNVIASDFKSESLKLAMNKGIEIKEFDITRKFPYKNAAFNGIFAGEIIEHLFDIRHFLSECNRILDDNGVLILTTPNLAILQDRIRFLFGFSPRQINPLHKFYSLHIRPFTYSKLADVLNENGFNVRSLKSNIVSLHICGRRILYSKGLAKIFPKLGGTLIVSARKNGMFQI